MSGTAPKRSRASAEQLNAMVDYMLNNPGLAGGKFKKLHGKLECDKWAQLAANLNCLGGAVKEVNQWQAVWKELKSRTSSKVRDRKRQQALTGNKPVTQEALSDMEKKVVAVIGSDMEKKVVAVIGSDYIEGHEDVVENIPMEETLQILMEDGEELGVPSLLHAENFDLGCDTPSTSKRTPRRGLKRKRAEDDHDSKKLFLEIASKQADALKLLAECTASNTETNKVMAETTKVVADGLKLVGDGLKLVGEGLKETAAAINNLGVVISKILKE